MNDRAESELDRLYGLPLGEFTAARNAAAKQLRPKDREAAEIIAKAAKPTRAAWAANQLSRRETRQVQALLRTGDRLRAAESPEALREAMRDQREALDRLVRSGRKHFGDLNQATIDQVRQTLHAATIDDEARALLERGRFIKEQQAVGFVPLDRSAPAAAAPRHGSGRARERRAAERRLSSATERVAKARRELERATAAAQDAQQALATAEARLARAESEEAQARSELDESG